MTTQCSTHLSLLDEGINPGKEIYLPQQCYETSKLIKLKEVTMEIDLTLKLEIDLP